MSDIAEAKDGCGFPRDGCGRAFFDGPFWAAAQLRGRLQDRIENERTTNEYAPPFKT